MMRIKGLRDIATHGSLSRRQKTAANRGTRRISPENKTEFRSADWNGKAERHLVAKAKPSNGPRPIHEWVWRRAIRNRIAFLEKELVEINQFSEEEGIAINPREVPDLQRRIIRLSQLLSQ